MTRMHYLFFFFVGIALAAPTTAELKNLERCWDKSLGYLDKAKSDIYGSYDKDPWFKKHKQQSERCRAMRADIKREDVKLIPCYLNDKRKYECEAKSASH